MNYNNKMRSLAILAVALLTVANAWSNTPPIPERHSGWADGKNK